MRRALLAADLDANVSFSELATFTDPLVLEEATAAGLLVVDRSRVRPSHPLLGAAARLHSTARDRREVHVDLASAVQDPTLQVRHRALATTGHDADLAARLAAACTVAVGRGATHEAEELAAEALRLTPRSDGAYRERLLVLARCHLAAGDLQRAGALLGERLAEFPAGPERARAHLLLGEAVDGRSEEAHLELALTEAGDVSEIRAAALIRRATLRALYRVDRLDEAEAWAQAAVEARRRIALISPGGGVRARLDPDPARPPDRLICAAWAYPAVRSELGFYMSVDRPFGVRLAFRGEVAQARAVFGQLRSRAEDLGDLRFRLGRQHPAL